MKKHAFSIAFALGLLVLLWVALQVARSHPLVLVMTLLIGGVYLTGARELQRFSQNTQQLAQCLANAPTQAQALEDWLPSLPAGLQHLVRQRIEGMRLPLPGPVLTPYLIGLLVMLGMLGTFLGMVVTLNGAVFALEGSTSVQGMRAALSEPVRGLGLAFGTSVAGVASSAMLGLMSSLARRQRGMAAQRLDQLCATVWQGYSHTARQQATLQQLLQNTQVLPQLAQLLEGLTAGLQQHSQQLGTQLLAGQAHFHAQTREVRDELARSVDQSLRHSLTQSAQIARDTLLPVVQATLQELALQSGTLQQQLQDSFTQRSQSLLEALREEWRQGQEWQEQLAQQRLQEWRQTLERSAAELQSQWQKAASQTLTDIEQLLQGQQEQARARATAEARWQAQQGEHNQALAALVQQQTQALREQEVLQAQATAERLRLEQVQMAGHRQLLAELETLLESLEQTSQVQRQAAQTLVNQSTQALQQATQEVQQHALQAAQPLAELVAQITASTVDLASLGDAFAFALRSFSETQNKLADGLQRIETGIDRSLARSDEQLAYYVAQARELIDLSVDSHREVLDALQQKHHEGVA